MWVGIGVGIGRNRFATGIFNDYALRVTADGGITEAGQCVDAVTGILLNASLLLIPSGYKGGKLYAEIPTNGNGDLTWTRGGDAFRTNASGVIQRVPWNLLQYSEQFNDAYWSKTGSSITSNSTSSPNSTLTADSLIEDSSTGLHFTTATITVITNTTYTATIYVKANTRTKGRFRLNDTGGQPATDGNFDLSAETISAGTITNVGGGWYRLSLSRLMGSTSASIVLFLADNSGNISYTGNGTSGLYLWGAQLVEGTTAQTYLPTTDRLNFPRLSYMYGSCPSALLEPQRTNLCLYSDQFNTGWSPATSGTGSVTITANYATSPDGTQNADRLQLQGGSGYAFVGQVVTVTNGTVYTYSVWLKALSGTPNVAVIFDGSTVRTATLTSEWVRYTFSFTGTGGSTYPRVGVWQSNWGTSLNADVLVYGAQLEAGAYPTTYIPTTSATASRLADSFSRSNIYTNGLISASGGTWFVELRGNVAYTRDGGSVGLNLDESVLGNGFAIRNGGTTGRLIIQKYIGGSGTLLYTTTTDTTKIAIKWNGTTADIFENGTKVVSSTSFAITNMGNLALSSGQVPYFIQQMALFPTPLTDTQCQTLTT